MRAHAPVYVHIPARTHIGACEFRAGPGPGRSARRQALWAMREVAAGDLGHQLLQLPGLPLQVLVRGALPAALEVLQEDRRQRGDELQEVLAVEAAQRRVPQPGKLREWFALCEGAVAREGRDSFDVLTSRTRPPMKPQSLLPSQNRS